MNHLFMTISLSPLHPLLLLYPSPSPSPQLLEFDKELAVFKDRLHELEIAFPPRYGVLSCIRCVSDGHLLLSLTYLGKDTMGRLLGFSCH